MKNFDLAHIKDLHEAIMICLKELKRATDWETKKAIYLKVEELMNERDRRNEWIYQ
jgi:hypothetical protein